MSNHGGLATLHSDVIIIIMQFCPVSDLASLAMCCRSMNALVKDFGWFNHLRANQRPSNSLTKSLRWWDAFEQVKYNTLTDRAFSHLQFISRPLHPWSRKLQPVLDTSPCRLVVAAASQIFSYEFLVSRKSDVAPSLRFEGSCSILRQGESRRDITALTFIPDGGQDRTLILGFEDGTLERVVLHPTVARYGTRVLDVEIVPDAMFQAAGDLIESLSYSNGRILSLSSSGLAALIDVDDTNNLPHTICTQARSWASMLSGSSSLPYVAFGTSSRVPLAVHSVRESEVSSMPYLRLCMDQRAAEGRVSFSSAVYGLSHAPISAPWGNPENMLISGWYDGGVRIYDLRSSSRAPSDGSSSSPLLPVMSLSDPYSDDPIYAVSCGGGASSHIAAGFARHSVVSFWDIRSPADGWNVHAPGNDPSPVYALTIESSRLFGVTQSRPFVFDFGPGVTPSTYPDVLAANAPASMHRKKASNDPGFYVTKYKHRTREVY